MSSNPALRPLRLPSADLGHTALPRTRIPARSWFRVHRSKRDPIHFTIDAAHRFSHLDCTAPLLYMGADIETCLWERFGDTMFDGEHHLPASLWLASSVSEIHLPEIHVCDLTSTATRNRLHVDLSALTSFDLSIPQAWGLAIQQHPARFDGIRYRSRFCNRPCLALFNHAGRELTSTLLGALEANADAAKWLESYEVILV